MSEEEKITEGNHEGVKMKRAKCYCSKHIVKFCVSLETQGGIHVIGQKAVTWFRDTFLFPFDYF